MRNIQLLHIGKPFEGLRQDSGECVGGNVQDRHISKQPNLSRQASGEMIVQENNLLQRAGHFTNAAWNAALEMVIGNHHNRGGRVSEIFRNSGCEPVVVHKQSIQVLVEELRRQLALKIIVPNIKVF